MVDVIERVGQQCFMPLTVGGGIRTIEDMGLMLHAGADKVSVNSAALANPALIRAGAEKYGSQCIVVSIDARRTGPDTWGVFSHGGRRDTGRDPSPRPGKRSRWGGRGRSNSIDADGTKQDMTSSPGA
jgi:cyclase